MAKSGTLAEAKPSKRAWCHPKLKKFLQENNAYDEFIANCKRDKTWNPNTRFHKLVEDGFSWTNAPEGFHYWNELELKHIT